MHPPQIGTASKNSYMGVALGARVGVGEPLARPLLSLKDNGDWLRQS